MKKNNLKVLGTVYLLNYFINVSLKEDEVGKIATEGICKNINDVIDLYSI